MQKIPKRPKPIKTSYKAKIASNSAFSSMVRHIDKKKLLLDMLKMDLNLADGMLLIFLEETIFT